MSDGNTGGVQKSLIKLLDSYEPNAAIVEKVDLVGEGVKAYNTMIYEPMKQGLAFSIKSAAEMQIVGSKFSRVFDDMGENTKIWAENHANLIGRSVIDIQGYLSETQLMLTSIGANKEKSVDLSKEIVKLGISYALFHNKSEADVIKSLTKAIAGNAEEAKTLGIRLDETTLSLDMNNKKIAEHDKQMDRYNAILKQTQEITGFAEDNTESFTNQLLRLKGVSKDTAAAFGVTMLPLLTKIISLTGDVIKAFGELPTWAQYGILGIAAAAMLIGPLITGLFNLVMMINALATLGPLLTVIFGGLAGLFTKGIAGIMGFGLVFLKGVIVPFAAFIGIFAAAIGLGLLLAFILNKVGETMNKVGKKYEEAKIPEIMYDGLPGYHKGTNYHPGGLALVGERGPELLRLPKGSRVATNYRTERILSSSSNATIDGSLQSNISSSSVSMPFAPQIVVNVEGREVNDSKTTLIKREIKDQILPMLEEYFSIMRLKHPILIER